MCNAGVTSALQVQLVRQAGVCAVVCREAEGTRVGEQPVPTIPAELLEREVAVKNATASPGHPSPPRLPLRGQPRCSEPHIVPTAFPNTVKHPLARCGWAVKAKANKQRCQAVFF